MNTEKFNALFAEFIALPVNQRADVATFLFGILETRAECRPAEAQSNYDAIKAAIAQSKV